MAEKYNKKLILEDGREFCGYSFGSDAERVCEVVFNTSVVGYQEIVSDPSYTDQAVVMTYPIIGSYGICPEDFETRTLSIGALIVREYNDEPSNFRSTRSLGELMKEFDIPGICGIDTRQLTRSIRDRGSRRAVLTGIDTTLDEGLRMIRETPVPHDAVRRVSSKEIKEYRAENEKYRVVLIDCGMKLNILRSLIDRSCSVTVVPYNTSPDMIKGLYPDAVMISNGPGDPEDVPETISTIRALRGSVPIFGICLGHQLIALACGARTYKLKFGHRGGNHPVRDLLTGRTEITSQNHSYAVDGGSIAGTGLEITHINLLDNTVEGARCVKDRMFSVQYHPESAPGPQDSGYLFDEFISLMEEGKRNA